MVSGFKFQVSSFRIQVLGNEIPKSPVAIHKLCLLATMGKATEMMKG